MHPCSSEVQHFWKWINEALVLEVKEQELYPPPAKEGEKPQTPFSHDYVTLKSMCWCRGTGRCPHGADDVDSLQPECWGTRDRNVHRAGLGPSAHRGQNNIMVQLLVTCQWATKCMFSFRFYSQCALNLYYIIATWNWSEKLVTCLQCIRTKVSGLSGVAPAGSLCPGDQKGRALYILKCQSPLPTA